MILDEQVGCCAFITRPTPVRWPPAVERAMVDPPGGVPARLTGAPAALRYVWPDVCDHFGS